ncbi:PhzF family phenazine biosynthesis protein [Anaeromyxobacter diazotrophicus]|uniref:Phenazine biosynthesis protein n=1 Tax=Anaeromyxobacter diazotrophicus TaxID=2590199 RepID=A0A7I9VRD5_9BACT|nr:PhzF family phenazine biosynthesis protein [Anaeromyxobacter diazotrophicus]GEJ58983.1 phenazine biosynthesis protein [Anaeromyxobacter diazotrophicus]
MTAPTARRLAFTLVDVFTSRPLEGNQLAVFTDARGLSGAEMQRLARETNLSETTFVLPGEAAPGATRVRIFTVDEELPFAGHPTLGTAAVLRGASGAAEVVLELGVGRVPVAFEDGPGGAFGEMRQRAPVFGARHDHREVARALGLPDGVLDEALPIETVSTGLAFAIAPVRSLAALERLRPDLARGADYLARTDARFFYFVARETVDPAARLHARMLFYGGEDPATGSAAGCCAAWMVAHGVARPDERVLIEQGLETRRPSRLHVRAGRRAGAVEDVRVGGHTVEVGWGELAF